MLSGVVKQARDYEDDSDFSTGPGTKVRATVAQIDADIYDKTDIDAVIQLPSGTAADLDRVSSITFEATIDRIDPFMRTLIVTGARLLDQVAGSR